MEEQHCYRHPDRETRVSCSRCERPICPDCMTTTSVGMRCPDCASEKTKVHTAASIARSPVAYATYTLMAALAGVFLLQTSAGGEAFSTRGGRAIQDGGIYGPAIAGDGEWWRLVSGGFLHSGGLHLAMNLFVLYILGTLLEPAIGAVRFFGVYMVSLLAGSLGALLVEPNAYTVGASGAVYGLMTATLVIARSRGIEGVVSQIGLWIGINLVFTLSVPGVSLGGHVGGLIGGGVAALMLLATDRVRGRSGTLVALLGLAVLAVAALAGGLWAADQPTATF